MLKATALSEKKPYRRKNKKEVRESLKKINSEPSPTQLIKSWGQFYKVASQVLSPIQNETEYFYRLELIDTLWDEARSEDDPRMPLVRLLLHTVAEWEKIHEAPYVEGVVGHVVLKSLMDEHKITQKQLEEEGIMQQSLVSKVLLGKRTISKTLAKRLAKRFKVSPALFI